MPYSLYWFALTGIIFLLQVLPVPGVFLMMMQAPFWPIFTINAGFVSLAIEVAMRGRIIEVSGKRLSRLWLLAPLAWFGGYFVATALNHQAFDALSRDIVRHNAGQALAFDPDKMSLVIDGGKEELDQAPADLMRSYALPVLYQTNTGSPGAAHRAYRLGTPEICRRLGDYARMSSGAGSFLGLPQKACGYYIPEDPSKEVVIVTVESRKETGLWLPQLIYRVKVSDGLGQSIDLLAGHAKPLRWFPQPFLGCGLVSAGSGWECGVFFLRQRARGLNGDGTYSKAMVDAVASALGLQPSPAEERVKAPTTASPDFDTLTAERIALSLANLDRIIANPSEQVAVEHNRGRISIFEVPGLIDRPDLLGPRAAMMVATLGQALEGSYATKDASGVLQHLLAALDARDFQRIGRNLLAVMDAVPDLDSGSFDDALEARLGDLGPQAIPVLERLAKASHDNQKFGIMLAICRMGPTADVLAEEVAGMLTKTKRTDDLHEVAYLALLRMGRPDLADADPDSDNRFQGKEYPIWRSSVTPGSPPNVCTNGRVWPKAPDDPEAVRNN